MLPCGSSVLTVSTCSMGKPGNIGPTHSSLLGSLFTMAWPGYDACTCQWVTVQSPLNRCQVKTIPLRPWECHALRQTSKLNSALCCGQSQGLLTCTCEDHKGSYGFYTSVAKGFMLSVLFCGSPNSVTMPCPQDGRS